MRYGRKTKLFNDINVIPYIDVTLVLLLVFMISAPLIEQGVEVELPNSSADQIDATQVEPVVITVSREGELFLNIHDFPDEALVAESLVAQVRAVRAVNAEVMVLVRGDANTRYQNVVAVMALLHNAGIEKVGLMTQPFGEAPQG